MSVSFKHLGQQAYLETWRAMREYTDQREENTADQVWLLEHPPTFTMGQNAKPEHLLAPGDIPVINTDRGGQVTYHGPGQLVAYFLLDLERRKISVRQLVSLLEQSIIQLLSEQYAITAHARHDAPGVYIDDAKIAALGLRVRHGRSYHGLSFNIAMDLEPFQRINPCGYSNMAITQLSSYQPGITVAQVEKQLIERLKIDLG